LLGIEDYKTHILKNKHMLYFFIVRVLVIPLKALSLANVGYSLAAMLFITFFHTHYEFKSGGDIKLWGGLIFWIGIKSFFDLYAISMLFLLLFMQLSYFSSNEKIKSYFYGETPVAPFVVLGFIAYLVIHYPLHISTHIIDLIL